MKKLLLIFLLFPVSKGWSQGNVGIGTPAPQAPLHINGGAEMIRLQGTECYIAFNNAAGTYRGYLWDNGSAMELGTAFGSNLPVYIAPGYSIKAVFLPNGNVGIGTLTPDQKLDVAGNIESSTAVTAPAHNFPAPKTYYYSVSEADVTKRNELVSIDRDPTGGGIVISGGIGKLTAPVHLPHGATVTRLTVYYNDVSSPYDMLVALRRSNTTTLMASVASTGFAGEGSVTDASIITPVINNSNTAYVLDIGTVSGPWPDYSLVFRRAVVEYTVSSL